MRESARKDISPLFCDPPFNGSLFSTPRCWDKRGTLSRFSSSSLFGAASAGAHSVFRFARRRHCVCADDNKGKHVRLIRTRERAVRSRKCADWRAAGRLTQINGTRSPLFASLANAQKSTPRVSRLTIFISWRKFLHPLPFHNISSNKIIFILPKFLLLNEYWSSKSKVLLLLWQLWMIQIKV